MSGRRKSKKDNVQERINHPLMEYYRFAYKDSQLWSGGSIEGKTLIVYCEQGYGDIIQFLRYIPILKERQKGKIYLHCPKTLHRLIDAQGWGVELLDKENPDLPEHDYHVLMMSLPFLLKGKMSNKGYLKVDEKEELPGGLNIGICWEGGPRLPHRDCPLKYFKPLAKFANLFMLQPGVVKQELIEECEDLELLGTEKTDFYDTAKLINSVFAVVSTDTASLHLAGAMGKQTFGLLSSDPDARWQYKWYDSATLLKGKWEDAIKEVEKRL
jgi:hypothetical protein